MIVAEQKPLAEIWEMIKEYRRVLILGCNTCMAICHAGGNKEGEILCSLLKIKAIQEHREITFINDLVEKQCEQFDLPEVEKNVQWADAILSTACGAGVQFTAEKFWDKPVLPALNTTFIGVTQSKGFWTEKCQACGNCILAYTGGICPIARCPKRLLNGPCGGSTQGKCEINPEQDCAWQLIIDHLKALGKLHLYEQLTELKDWSTDRAGGPRNLNSKEQELIWEES